MTPENLKNHGLLMAIITNRQQRKEDERREKETKKMKKRGIEKEKEREKAIDRIKQLTDPVIRIIFK